MYYWSDPLKTISVNHTQFGRESHVGELLRTAGKKKKIDLATISEALDCSE